MSILPPYVSRDFIAERLPTIFPEGTPNRNYCIRELAASTIFTMLYVGAVEGNNTYAAPVHVYRMTEEQSILNDDGDRLGYGSGVVKKGFTPLGKRWYADNTREPIRDETLREGLVRIGAVQSLMIDTTSSKPRYFLQRKFSELFDPVLTGIQLAAVISEWQEKNLSKSALTRISLANQQSKSSDEKVWITFPNKTTRAITPGASAEISKAVIEVFSKEFLGEPVVLWLSTSSDKVVANDEKLAASIGIKIQADKYLPDIILVDLKPDDPLIVFVEVVATDGPITEHRQKMFYEITDEAKFKRSQVAFVTAYLDRNSPGFKKTMGNLAWNSYAWFVSEPDKIIVFKDGAEHLAKIGIL
jgi:BsuBI/PstI restriction endonuclease domain/BsuBI/PstI restriction endonuclease HTH domain